MLEARPEQLGDSPSTEAGATLQQPRSDLQQSAAQDGSASSPQTVPTLPQQQLTAEGLRVENTNAVVQNTTTTSTTSSGADWVNAAWLWLFVPLILAVVLFWPRKKTAQTAVIEDEAAQPAPQSKTSTTVVEADSSDTIATSSPTATKKKRKTKGTRAGRRKHTKRS